MENRRRNARALCRLCAFIPAAVVVLSFSLYGCRSINPLPRFALENTSPEEKRIKDLMDWHSGSVEVYREFRTVFTARAVFLSEEIRRRAVDWEARTKLMTPEEKADFEKRHLAGDENQLKFLVGFYTPREENNDLDMENTLWVPVLREEDGSVRRAACFGMGYEEAKIYMRFLEWDLSWSKLYLICFPYDFAGGDAVPDRVTMVITGPEGKGEMEIRTAPPDDRP